MASCHRAQLPDTLLPDNGLPTTGADPSDDGQLVISVRIHGMRRRVLLAAALAVALATAPGGSALAGSFTEAQRAEIVGILREALRSDPSILREALEVIRTPNVALETSAPNAPGVVKPVGDDQFLHVIMPMHLG